MPAMLGDDALCDGQSQAIPRLLPAGGIAPVKAAEDRGMLGGRNGAAFADDEQDGLMSGAVKRCV